MKSYYRVLSASIVVIILFWVLDAAVDSVIHYDESFLESLIFNDKEFAFRSLFSACFLIFGIFMANVISRQKEAEINKLTIASNEWRNTFDSISDFVSVHDTDFIIVKANKALAAYAGMGYKELIGKHCYKIFHGTSKPIDNCPHQKAIELRKAVTEEIYEPSMEKHLHISCSPYYDENQNLIGSVHIAKDITERKQMEESLRQSLIDKELLIKEINHRVKNNLAVIQSLLALQSRGIIDEESKSSFHDIQNRVKSMSMIHDRLSSSKDLSRLNFSEFVSSLTNYLYHSYKLSPTKVNLNLSIPDIHIDIDIMMPCGLIINELVSNAFKHAFQEDKEGEVSIELHEGEDDEITLIVRDNGIGISNSIDIRNTTSLGLQIVSSLTNQIHGKLELFHDKGTEFRIKFHKSKKW
jgi:PAS domain S-box-containing protein